MSAIAEPPPAAAAAPAQSAQVASPPPAPAASPATTLVPEISTQEAATLREAVASAPDAGSKEKIDFNSIEAAFAAFEKGEDKPTAATPEPKAKTEPAAKPAVSETKTEQPAAAKVEATTTAPAATVTTTPPTGTGDAALDELNAALRMPTGTTKQWGEADKAIRLAVKKLKKAYQPLQGRVAELEGEKGKLTAQEQQEKVALEQRLAEQEKEWRQQLDIEKTQHQSLRERLMADDVERTPEYEQHVRKPRQEVSAFINGLADDENYAALGFSTKRVNTMLAETDPAKRRQQFNELASILQPGDQAQFVQAMAIVPRYQQADAQLRQNARQLLEQRAARERAQQDAQGEARTDAALRALREYRNQQSPIATFLSDVSEEGKEGDELTAAKERNQLLKDYRAAVEQHLRKPPGDMKPENYARFVEDAFRAQVLSATALQELQKKETALKDKDSKLQEQEEQIQDLQRQVHELTGVLPGNGAGAGSAPSDDDGDRPADLDGLFRKQGFKTP